MGARICVPFRKCNEILSKEEDNPDPLPTLRATNLICSSLRFLDTYRAGKLKPEVYHLNPRKSDTAAFERFVGLLPRSIATYGAYLFKAFPLDMSQFESLFSSTRIAIPEQDELRNFPNSRHLAVISNGDIFIFDIIDEQGCHLNPRQILANLEFIQHRPVRDRRQPNRSSGIGIMTAMQRDSALMTRDRLESLGNKRNLDLIDSALFVLVLSDETTDHFPEVVSISSSYTLHLLAVLHPVIRSPHLHFAALLYR
ncbi:unnamed protein product [Dibothriocephalus latus]|uniref:Choline/carnitine acyltransferase domain-containing protein n=1 Tax=Dibothriocephalus latus TaxID=60516 RepID=A0A3P7LJR0_DIBLA|nr:unnamed protein product [Dibothriocephalus latus]